MYGDARVVSFPSFFLSLLLSGQKSCRLFHKCSLSQTVDSKHALAQLTDIRWHIRIILACSCEVSRTNFSR
jgi:hypothetical protein